MRLQIKNFEKKFFIIFLIIICFFAEKEYIKNLKNIKNIKFDTNFKYHYYQRELITEKMKKYSNWQLSDDEPYFINGIIRKYKPKKCLEIGVAHGGSTIVILNAIKDIKNSFLISLDLNTMLYNNNHLKTGYTVNKYFSELTDKWKLYTGDQPHKFLDKLNLKFDFLFLDTAHLSPGELINIIEVLPFLNDNPIIILHDIMYHLPSNKYYNHKEIKFHPSNIFLMTALYGDKIIIENKEKKVENIGAIYLYSNQQKYYLNYFLLLLTPWEYMPTEEHIKDLRKFIIKYYKKDIYLNLFDQAIEENKNYINTFKGYYNPIINTYK